MKRCQASRTPAYLPHRQTGRRVGPVGIGLDTDFTSLPCHLPFGCVLTYLLLEKSLDTKKSFIHIYRSEKEPACYAHLLLIYTK